jgi:hypothetical protein
LRAQLARIRGNIAQVAMQSPRHADFIAQHCAAA